MAALHCPCEEKHEIWGELWWVGGKHEWVFFDDRKTSGTYTVQLTHCLACGRKLERRSLLDATGRA
jgi:hypothetical protein